MPRRDHAAWSEVGAGAGVDPPPVATVQRRRAQGAGTAGAGTADGATRSGRGAHAAPRRLPIGRLSVLVAACLAGSFLVAGVASLVPPPPPVLAAAEDEVAFDAEELRSQLPAYVASGTLYGRWAGEPVVVRPKPVAGLDQARTDNAFVIIEVGQELKLPRRAYVVAIATALQESNLRNLANSSVSASLKLPHEGAARDFDSVGLFQQRPSQGWGSVPQLMDPAQSAAKFYNKLRRVSNWEDLSVARAAQAVQRSAFPDAYAKHTVKAETIVDGILTQLPAA